MQRRPIIIPQAKLSLDEPPLVHTHPGGERHGVQPPGRCPPVWPVVPIIPKPPPPRPGRWGHNGGLIVSRPGCLQARGLWQGEYVGAVASVASEPRELSNLCEQRWIGFAVLDVENQLRRGARDRLRFQQLLREHLYIPPVLFDEPLRLTTQLFSAKTPVF